MQQPNFGITNIRATLIRTILQHSADQHNAKSTDPKNIYKCKYINETNSIFEGFEYYLRTFFIFFKSGFQRLYEFRQEIVNQKE